LWDIVGRVWVEKAKSARRLDGDVARVWVEIERRSLF
jgi:hypothetical protein